MTQSASADAALACAMLAVDPLGLGGMVLQGGPGPGRDAVLALLRAGQAADAPFRRMPIGISDSRLLGGIDLGATLRAGTRVAERGLLAEADGGLVIVAMAERLAPMVAAQLCLVLDSHLVRVARDGVEMQHQARIACVALDESVGADEAVPATLRDRLAFTVSAEAGVDEGAAFEAGAIARARAALPSVETPEEMVTAITATALALGVWSLRPSLLALRAARAMAALRGADAVGAEDAALAARLVLAPRATRLPEAEPEVTPEQEASPPPEDQPEEAAQTEPRDGPMQDRVLDAARAAIPADLLAQLAAGAARAARARGAGKSGAMQKSASRGRPGPVRRGMPGPRARLNLIETLRAASPWQRLRGNAPGSGERLQLRPDDFQVTRFKQRRETTTIFVVDASGSLAANRLPEAKGAVELLLAECYVRRDQVALIAFRGARADLLLPPTRSLVRAKRSLRQLPGGGGTPLAAGLMAAADLASAIARRGGTPAVVVLTDGSANVALDGSQGRARAGEDARLAARVLAATGTRVLLVDTSQRPQAAARAVADAMAAAYLALPVADATRLSRAVQQALPAA